jgi:3-oxoacyl-[acyl-carrier protein] reductase
MISKWAGGSSMSFDLKLAGKVAIVTGATRGIGRAIAVALAKEGADIGIAARTESESASRSGTIYSVADEVRALGRKAIPIRTDVSKESDVRVMAETVMKELGSIDILVNNAAIFPLFHTPLIDFPATSWDLTMDVNLRGVFLCIKAVLPHMIKKGSGSIINISSLASMTSGKGRIAYGAAKAALERLTYGLSEEIRDSNIAVNALSPLGLTETESVKDLYPDADHEKWVRPEDVARGAVWLACQDARKFTGRAVAAPAGGRVLIVYGRATSEWMWTEIE